MENKSIAITILIVALVASGIGNIILALIQDPVPPPDTSDYLVCATSSGPDTLEPVDCWDSASNDVLEQVVETLFYYDLTDTDLPRINLLAYSYYWTDTTHLQIQLREGIHFHDGTPFNAEAAKWNLDRLQYLTNCSGTNPYTVAQTQSLWMFPDGETPIMDTITTVGEYNITITLNDPYGPLLNTLAYINAGMISPTAHADEFDTFIDLTTGHPIGTGPFKYVKYVPGVEVRFVRNDAYWMEPANFPGVIFALYRDVTTAHDAFISYDVDWNRMPADQNLAAYEADPKLEVYRFTEDTGKPSLVYQYLGFNNKKFNVTWRKALSYAINYTYIIDELREGKAVRANSPISPGFGSSYNSSSRAADYNISKAREMMVSMGFGDMGWNDTQWINVAESGSPFRSVYFYVRTGNRFCENLYVALFNWFKLIGVMVSEMGDDPWCYLCYLYIGYDDLDLYTTGWGPDYLDPFNILDPLFNPASRSNSAQVDDAHLNTLMTSALAETDEGARNIIYQNIQGYLARMQFHAPLYHSTVLYSHNANLHNIPYNPMGALRIYPVYRGLYAPFAP